MIDGMPWYFSEIYPLGNIPVSTLIVLAAFPLYDVQASSLVVLAVLPSVRCPRFLPGTNHRCAPAVALTQMHTVGRPIAGWPSSGRCGRTARPRTNLTAYNNVLGVGGLDPSSAEVHVNPL
jgi:hypothetical protein